MQHGDCGERLTSILGKEPFPRGRGSLSGQPGPVVCGKVLAVLRRAIVRRRVCMCRRVCFRFRLGSACFFFVVCCLLCVAGEAGEAAGRPRRRRVEERERARQERESDRESRRPAQADKRFVRPGRGPQKCMHASRTAYSTATYSAARRSDDVVHATWAGIGRRLAEGFFIDLFSFLFFFLFLSCSSVPFRCLAELWLSQADATAGLRRIPHASSRRWQMLRG